MVGARPDLVHIEAIFEVMQQMMILSEAGTRTTLAIWRALLNGWPTSHRFHEAPAHCFAGCRGEGAEDSLRHYLRCPRLWFVIKVCTAPPHPPEEPIARLGCRPCGNLRHRLLQLAVATRVALCFRLEPHCRTIAINARSAETRKRLGRELVSRAREAALDMGGRDFARSPTFAC